MPEPAAAAAVLFDLDGVLILSEAAHLASWRQVLLPRGVDLTPAMFKATFGRTNRDTIRALLGELPPAEAERLAEAKERRWREAIRGAVPLAPGALAVLRDLRAEGFALALGSSAPPANVAAALDGTGLRELLPVIVDGSMVARGKPDPEVFLRCAAGLGVVPGCCVVVEDAPAGIQAALAGGMRAIGIPSAHQATQLQQEGAHAVAPTLAAVTPDLIRRALS